MNRVLVYFSFHRLKCGHRYRRLINDINRRWLLPKNFVWDLTFYYSLFCDKEPNLESKSADLGSSGFRTLIVWYCLARRDRYWVTLNSDIFADPWLHIVGFCHFAANGLKTDNRLINKPNRSRTLVNTGLQFGSKSLFIVFFVLSSTQWKI